MKIADTSYDKTGIFVSVLCIFHCAVLPAVIGLLPALGINWMVHNPKIHLSLFLLMILFATTAFVIRYKDHHSKRPAIWLSAGILFVGLGHFVFSDHRRHMMMNTQQASLFDFSFPTVLAVIGGIFLIYGHYLNQKRACCLH